MTCGNMQKMKRRLKKKHQRLLDERAEQDRRSRSFIARDFVEKGLRDELEEPHFHDIDTDIIERDRMHEKEQRKSGSTAENILQDVGVVAAAKTI